MLKRLGLFQGWAFAHVLSPTSLPCTQPFLIQVPQFEMSQIQASQVPGQFLVRFPCPLYNLELPIHLLFSLLLSPGEQGTRNWILGASPGVLNCKVRANQVWAWLFNINKYLMGFGHLYLWCYDSSLMSLSFYVLTLWKASTHFKT